MAREIIESYRIPEGNEMSPEIMGLDCVVGCRVDTNGVLAYWILEQEENGDYLRSWATSGNIICKDSKGKWFVLYSEPHPIEPIAQSEL